MIDISNKFRGKAKAERVCDGLLVWNSGKKCLTGGHLPKSSRQSRIKLVAWYIKEASETSHIPPSSIPHRNHMELEKIQNCQKDPWQDSEVLRALFERDKMGCGFKTKEVQQASGQWRPCEVLRALMANSNKHLPAGRRPAACHGGQEGCNWGDTAEGSGVEISAPKSSIKSVHYPMLRWQLGSRVGKRVGEGEPLIVWNNLKEIIF